MQDEIILFREGFQTHKQCFRERFITCFLRFSECGFSLYAVV